MPARTRLLPIIGITIVVGGGAMSLAMARFVEWHRNGWAGLSCTPSFPSLAGGRFVTFASVTSFRA